MHRVPRLVVVLFEVEVPGVALNFPGALLGAPDLSILTSPGPSWALQFIPLLGSPDYSRPPLWGPQFNSL